MPAEPNLCFVFVGSSSLGHAIGFCAIRRAGSGFDAAMLVGSADGPETARRHALFRVLFILVFVISVIMLTLREIIIGARSKRLRQLAAGADAEPTRHKAAVYVRERGDTGT